MPKAVEVPANADGTLQAGFSTPNHKFRERNAKVLKKVFETDEEFVGLKESMKRLGKKLGFKKDLDITDAEAFPVREDGFSWKRVHKKLREADAASSFVQVLRAGVQTIVNAAYMEMVGTTYEDWVHTVQSSKDTELYAPLHGVGFPREVARGEKFPEVGAVGLDISLRNREYGTIYPVEEQLLEDDQTGQFQNQASLLGEYMKLLIEALCYAKLASVSNMTYGGNNFPVSETKPTEEAVYPWVTPAQKLVGGGYNRPTTYTILTKAGVQAAKTQLMNQKNKLGLKMSVDGNRLLVGPSASFDAATLMNSTFFPSVAGSSAGTTGGQFAVNPIKGLADISVSRFMYKNDGTVDGDSLAWYLVDQKKPWFVCQLRSAVQIVEEAPNSGQGFERKVKRFRVDQRLNADFIDPRFAFQGNDGSVTS